MQQIKSDRWFNFFFFHTLLNGKERIQTIWGRDNEPFVRFIASPLQSPLCRYKIKLFFISNSYHPWKNFGKITFEECCEMN